MFKLTRLKSELVYHIKNGLVLTRYVFTGKPKPAEAEWEKELRPERDRSARQDVKFLLGWLHDELIRASKHHKYGPTVKRGFEFFFVFCSVYLLIHGEAETRGGGVG